MARPRVHDGALRTRLLEVASRVVADHGPAGLTVRDVAARAGTSASAVYALFGGREELVQAVGEEALRRFAAHLAAAPRTDDPGADLLALGLAYRASALDDPHFYRVMFHPVRTATAGGPTGAAVTQPTFAVLVDAVARVLRAHGEPASTAEPAAVPGALALWGLAHGLVDLELSGLLAGTGEERAARYRAALLAVGLAAVGRSPDGPVGSAAGAAGAPVPATPRRPPA